VSGAPLVTGGGGFAGRHLVAHLRALGDEPVAPRRAELDLLEPTAVHGTVRELRPRAVFHLAALASVASSWERPRETVLANVEMALNVLEAVRAEAPDAVLLMAGSGEVYGSPERLPVTESAALRPQNPYAASKAACDLLAAQYADAHGLRVVRTRAFNHAGPGQSEEYVLGTLTRQVAEAEAGGRSRLLLRTGNLDSARDFTDVRDVVRAYAAVASAEPGAYNVCSGRSTSVRELIELLGRCTELEIDHEVDPARVRRHDVREIRGSSDRLREATGWSPEIPLERTIRDAIDAWRERLASER
jgi:GDP-4-dehydro-6-deoxy-D-mannose reductase